MIVPDPAWETKLYKAERGFRIDNKPAGRLSLAANPDDGLVAVIQIYLLEGALRIGDNWRTIEKYGYVLCEWYDYLRFIGIGIFDANEDHLRNFLLGGGKRYSNVQPLRKPEAVVLDSTNKVKMLQIVAFYDFWERVRGKRLRFYRGTTLARLNEELFARHNRSISIAKINFSRSEASKGKTNPGTPTQQDVEQLLDVVLDQCDNNRAQTWYFVGCLAAKSGSRGIGISSLTVANFLKGMQDETAIRKMKNYRVIFENFLKPENRELIKLALQQLRATQRTYIFCDVDNKGGGEIPIAIPIELAVELLDYICTSRQEFIDRRLTSIGLVAPPNIFLSNKIRVCGGVLQQESMGNRFNKLMNELDIDGTFHRMRASFCEEIVREIYIRERAVNGRAWQINNVLEFARKLLGHKNPHSVEHYLNNIMAQELLFGDPVMVESPQDTPYVRGLCAALSGENQENLRKQLARFLEDNCIEPLNEDKRKYALI